MPEDKSSPDFVFYVSKTKISDLVCNLYHNIVLLSQNEQWYRPQEIKMYSKQQQLFISLFICYQ